MSEANYLPAEASAQAGKILHSAPFKLASATEKIIAFVNILSKAVRESQKVLDQFDIVARLLARYLTDRLIKISVRDRR